MIESGDKIFAAVSGGADSVCLLLVLNNLKSELDFKLEVVTVDHGLRGEESLKDVEFVEKLCERLNIICHTYHVDVAPFRRNNNYSIEEAARILRYECFEKHINEGKIAIAHNMEDNAETLIFNITRGCGIYGLRGIGKVRENYIRPLIECSRVDIESYLNKMGESFCTDSTNEETDYARNKIRHNVMPILREINPSVAMHISKMCDMQKEAVNYIDRQTKKAYDRYVNGNTLSGDILNEDLIIITSVIRLFLIDNAKTAKDIASVHIDSVLKLLDGGVGRQIDLPYCMRAVSSYDCVKIVSDDGEQESKKPDDLMIMPLIREIGDKEVVICDKYEISLMIVRAGYDEITSKSYTKMLDYDKISDKLCIRHRRKGDYLTIDSYGNKKSLNRYMIDTKIPREDRDRVILFSDGAHIMYVAAHRISEYYKVDDKTKRILKIDITRRDDGGTRS